MRALSLALVLAVAAPARVTRAQNETVADPADTGRLLRGHIDFSRYDTPGACNAAAWLEIRSSLVHRTPDPNDPQDRDTLQGALLVDTIPGAAAAVARRCGARFTVTGVPAEELPNLQRLALLMGDSAVAASAVARRLAMARTERERADALLATVEMYRTARPARLAATAPLLKALDALGAAARPDRLRAHMEILRDYDRRFDRSGIRREADAVLSLIDELPTAERDMVADTIPSVYNMLLAVQEYEDPRGINAVLDRAHADLSRVRNGQMVARHEPVPGWFTREWWDFMHQHSLELQLPVAQYWFNTGGTSPWHPTPGHLTLFVGQYADPSVVRALHTKYASRGLDLVMYIETLGWAQVNGQEHVMAPEQEADAYRRQYIDNARLPVALGVVVKPITRDSASGERIDTGVQYGTPIDLLDRAGHYVTYWTGMTDDLARIETYIDREVAKP